MRTLYLRNVPDEAVADLEAMAAAESIAVSALAVRELAAVARARRQLRELEAVPPLDVSMTDLVDAVRDGREGRDR